MVRIITFLFILLVSESALASEIFLHYEGQSTSMPLSEGTTTDDVEEYARQYFINLSQDIRLFYSGAQLQQNNLLLDYGIKNQAFIELFNNPVLSAQGAPPVYLYEFPTGRAASVFKERLKFGRSIFYVVEFPDEAGQSLYRYEYETKLNRLVYKSESETNRRVFSLIQSGDQVFFHATYGENQAGFFHLNPMTNEINKIADVDHTSGLQKQRLVGEYQGKLYFSGLDESGSASVMVYDLSNQSSYSIEDEYAYPGDIQYSRHFVVSNDTLYFTARVSGWGETQDEEYNEVILAYSEEQGVNRASDQVPHSSFSYKFITPYKEAIYSVQSSTRDSLKYLDCTKINAEAQCFDGYAKLSDWLSISPEILGVAAGALYFEKQNTSTGELEIWRLQDGAVSYVIDSNVRTITYPEAPWLFDINEQAYLLTNEGFNHVTNDIEVLIPGPIFAMEQQDNRVLFADETGLSRYVPDSNEGTVIFTSTDERFIEDASWVSELQDSYLIAGTFTEGNEVYQGSLVVVQLGENMAPVIQSVSYATVEAEQETEFLFSAMDPEGEALTFTIENKPSWAEFNQVTGRLWGTPTENDVGEFTNVIVSVSDESGQRAFADTFSIEVTSTSQDNEGSPIDIETPKAESPSGGILYALLMLMFGLLIMRNTRVSQIAA